LFFASGSVVKRETERVPERSAEENIRTIGKESRRRMEKIA
jgi:hypothetical protein